MMENKQLNKSCFYYEMFMERAHGLYEVNIPGRHAETMKRLLEAEGKKIVSMESVIRFESLLDGLKMHVEEALDHYMEKPHVPQEMIDQLKQLKEMVVWCVSSDELMRIVFDTIDLTASLSIAMEVRSKSNSSKEG